MAALDMVPQVIGIARNGRANGSWPAHGREAAKPITPNAPSAPSRVAGVGGQHPFVDAKDRQRPIVFTVEIGVENEANVGGAGEPAVGEDLALELPRGPAGV